MTSQAPADSLFDCFIACRAPNLVPSDFDLMMLDAILAMSGVAQQQPAAGIADILPLYQYSNDLLLPLVSLRNPDRLFPISLLKCPLDTFITFCKRYKLQSALVKTLREARRRKTNRKFQRITRNRRRGMEDEMDNAESDDEGECLVLDDQAVLDMLAKATDFKKA